MRLQELSEVTGVSVPSIKYYLREGLLPSGTPRTRNQADYGETHVRRLRLIRALIEVADLSVASVRLVIGVVEDETATLHEAFGTAQDALSGRTIERDGTEEWLSAQAEVQRWLAGLAWHVRPGTPAEGELVDALVMLRRFEWATDASIFDHLLAHTLADAADEVATVDAAAGRSAQLEHVVIGTVAFERAGAALRRLALEHHSALRFRD